jgi:hypothetical protein
MPAFTSKAIGSRDPVMLISQISNKRLAIPCVDQDKACAVFDFNDPLKVCDILSTAARFHGNGSVRPMKTSKWGHWQEELRANRIAETKTVPRRTFND